jgi:hypothetical protein
MKRPLDKIYEEYALTPSTKARQLFRVKKKLSEIPVLEFQPNQLMEICQEQSQSLFCM